MQNLFAVKDRVVVVTGGLGQLGRQFTRSLASQGARVAVFDINATNRPHADLAEHLERKEVLLVDADITQRSSLEQALARVNQIWGPVYGLVNNAALDAPPNAPPEETGPFETYPEASWDKVMEVNVKGVFLACQVIGGQMASVGRGSIISIGSIYGSVSPNQTIYDFRRQRGEVFFKPVAYSASKSALINLTHYLATYWARSGVRVNLLTFAGVFNHQDPEFLKAYTPHVPLGRMAREDEYNGAVTFLLSDAASYMTGSNLVIDGGWTAW